MAITRLLINSLSGGVGRQVPTKRLVTEAENIDNCLVTLEKSVEKRPPLSRITETGSGTSYLNVNQVGAPAGYNTDNLYFHFLDIDGFNRYCIIINRAGAPFDPLSVNNFTSNGVDIKLSDFITVYRIEPTEWVKETLDDTVGPNNTSGFNRGIYEYLTLGNRSTSSSYRIANTSYTVEPKAIKHTFGSCDLDVGIVLWNKLVPLDYLPDNGSQDIDPSSSSSVWFSSLPNSKKIHSGDVINYKITVKPDSCTPLIEDQIIIDEVANTNFWINVRDDIQFQIDSETLEETEVGQNLENFGEIPQYPSIEVYNDVRDLNGFKAQRMLYDSIDNPRIIPIPAGGIDNWNFDYYQLTSPLPKLDRDGNTSYYGYGKVYFARNPYLTFVNGFYRATRYTKNPYFERIRAEGPNAALDHRTFPIIIYKDTATDGKWRVKHMPLEVRKSGTSLTNPGLTSVKRKEKVQSIVVWKSRLWLITDNTVAASRTNDFYNFWINDINNIVETDPIDIQSSVGGYNQFTHSIPFQNLLFILSSGSTQFEVRGGSPDVGISAFNVELRPTSFFSTSKMDRPMKMTNNVFYTNNGNMFLYLSGSSVSDEFSTSMDISTHCKGYLPENLGATTESSGTNSLFMVDDDNKNYLYIFTFRSNGQKIIQNAFHRWILSTQDSILGCKVYEKDMYLISKRNQGNTPKLCVYFCSLETVPTTTPHLDWLYKVPLLAISQVNNNLVFTLPHQDTEADYVVLDGSTTWGTQSYTVIKIPEYGNTTNANNLTTISIPRPGNVDGISSVWVGRSYLMNVELSKQVKRGNDGVSEQVLEGVLNLKRITTRHFNTGNYDIKIERNNRPSTKVTFFPRDLNNIGDKLGQFLIETNGENYSKVLSYSEGTKLFIQSAYPTPCNISNIEILATWRARNTSIE